LREVQPSKVHRLFYPEVPAVLSASWRGRVSAMPVVSYMSLSSEPPLVGVSCDKRSYTYRVVRMSRSFSICLLDRRMSASVEYLATHSGRESTDKLKAAGLEHTRGITLPVPVIVGSEAVLECRLVSKRVTGDHVLVVGRVATARASDDFDEYWSFRKYRPILYTGWRNGLSTYD
jgi:flavin reductase (DIM6/NTAB) family NADH-FMN oxidoreductase RutF